MSLTVVCAIQGEDIVFPVEFPVQDQVFSLKKNTQQARELDTLRDVDPHILELWKLKDMNAIAIEPEDTLLERIRSMGALPEFAKKLGSSSILSEIFPTQPSMHHVHIIVKIPDGRPEKRSHEEDDAPESYKRLKLEVGMAASSTLGQPDQFQKIAGPDHAICLNRPYEFDTIPLVLLHETFGIFKDRCSQPPSEAAIACLNELAPTACMWYEKETQRRDAVQDVLRNHLRLSFHPEKVPGTEYTTDGKLTRAVVIMPPSVRECRGSALDQATLYYSKFLIHALDRPESFDTRFPCIIVVDIGSCLGFYGALWDGRVRVEPLTPVFDLATHWKESKSRNMIASSLDALVLAVENIRAHYKKIEAEASMTSAPKPLQGVLKFPFVTSYIDSGQKTSFTYMKRLDDDKLLFLAVVNDNRQDICIVKFTQRYSEAAHRILQSYNSAPTLRQCIRISAEWTAVVMDTSMYEMLPDLRLTKHQQEKIQRKVEETLQVLHDGGFVHGDVRSPNILIDVQSLESDDVRIHFVDFDWAGRIGEAKYPHDINRITVRRPEGAKGGELITVEHDRAMASYLFT